MDPESELQKALKQAETWRNRAAMAWQQNNRDLTQQALTRMWQYQVAAARLEGNDPPDGPPEPEDIFRGWDPPPGGDRPWRPYDPSRVPRNPLPSSGAGEIALPRPKSNEED